MKCLATEPLVAAILIGVHPRFRIQVTALSSALLLALAASPLRAQVRITEVMASNRQTLADDFGQAEDWIEIHNGSAAAVPLLDWALTDDPEDLRQWRFPALDLAPGGYLVVFASNRDRRDPAAPLHTNFRLDHDGEFLALVDPSGAIVSLFAPAFPSQVPDVSFGFGQELRFTTNLTRGAAGRVQVPTSGVLGTSWLLPDFDDATWLKAENGIGYDTRVSEVSFGGAATAVLESRPVGFWRLDEAQGPTVRNAGSLGATANTAAYGGTTFAAAGPRPNAFSGFEPDNRSVRFDGNNAKLETPYHSGLNPGQFTLECWARVTGGAGSYRSPVTSRLGQAGQQAGYLFYATPGDTWEFWTGSGGSWSVLSGGPVVYSQWTLLAGSYDGRTMRFYTNGALAAAEDFVFRPNDRYPFRIGGGATESEGQYFFVGEVDEVAVFDRALPAGEILRHFQAATRAAGGSAITNTGPSHFAGLIGTDLQTAMLDRSPSAYLRLPFVVTNLAEVDRFVLRMKYDDGFVAYLNGFDAASANAPTAPAWNATATARRDNLEAVGFEEFNLEDALPWLRVGTNLLAVHGLNDGATNADFLILAELETISVHTLGTRPGYLTTPTPGAPNRVAQALPGPLIQDTVHWPAQPDAMDDVVVTARVLPLFAPVASDAVFLHYRVMFGATNALPMFDDGQHGDGQAGDTVYGATIPGGASRAGQMVRWYLTAADTLGRRSRWPLFLDPLRSPEYLGTVVSDPSVSSTLPQFHWFAANPAAGRTRTGTRCAVFYEGEFYDNVFARERGGYTSYGSQKFDFNPGHLLMVDDAVGRVEEVNLNSNGSDPSFIRQPMAFEAFRLAGNAASASFHLLMRVNGGPDRVGIFIEQVDDRFLDRWGFDPEGALYKFTQRSTLTPVLSDVTNGVEKKTRLSEDRSDLEELVKGLALTHSTAQHTAFVFDRLNLPEVINYLAERIIIQDVDSVRKNFYLHCDTDRTREWSIFPWDKDWTFAVAGGAGPYAAHPFLGTQAYLLDPPNHQWSVLFEVLFNLPATREMYLRRIRTLMDRQLQAPGTVNGEFEPRALAWMRAIAPDVGLGVSNTVSGVLGYFPQRRADLYVTYAATNLAAGPNALIPAAQPANALVSIVAIDFNPASGNQDEEYVGLTNAHGFAVDISGWQLEGGIRFRFKPGTVIPAGKALYVSPDVVAFRRRATAPRGGQGLFVQGDSDGRLSAWGESLTLSDESGRLVSSHRFTGQPSPAQQFLRITEIMYHPAPAPGDAFDAQQYEYLELRNVATNVRLNLTGVRFTRGLSFNFTESAVRELAPGQRVLVVRNREALVSRHGDAFLLAGQFSGALENGGETLRLEDAAGEKILEFAYAPGWYPMTDGLGASLSIVDDRALWSTWGEKPSWRPSLDNEPPVVRLTAPAHGTAWPRVPPLELEATASDPDGAVQAVEFWSGATRLTTLSDPPYHWSWAEAPFGVHTLKAMAIDNQGLAGESSPVTIAITSRPPSVSLTSPIAGALAVAGDLMTLMAMASDPDSAVAGVDFYADEALLASVTKAPFSHRWPATAGRHTLMAVARDESGASAPATGAVFVQAVLTNTAPVVPPGSEWRYLDDGSNQGTNWVALTFNDTGWSKGLAELGYGDRPNGRPETTEIRFGSNANNKHVTSYFRHAFVLPSVDGLREALLEVLRDDGVVAYLNGVEVFRDNLVPGPIDHLTLAANATDDGTVFYPQPVEVPRLRAGTNILAVEIHQSSRSSSDLSFDAQLSVRSRVVGPAITRPPRDQTVSPGGDVLFTVEALGTAPLSYQWRFNGTALAGATNATLSLTNVQGHQAGAYAVAVSNAAGAVWSETARVSFRAPPPAITGVATSLGPFRLWVSSLPGFTYLLEWKGELHDTEWMAIPPATRGTGTVLELSDPQAPVAQRFYRVRVE